MASLRQIRRRMKSVENIHEITAAMEMIAAFRFKKAETRFSRSKPYLLEMEKLVANLSSSAKDLSDALFEKRDIKTKTLVVMAGDKGLCGAYNTNILKTAAQWMRDNKGVRTNFVPIGKIGYEFFHKKGHAVLSGYAERSMVDVDFARKVTEDLKELFLSKKTDSIELLYTTFKVGAAGQNRVVPFLSLSYLMEGGAAKAASMDYIYEPDFKGVFLNLLSRYVEGKLYLCLLESLTSEYSARMMAMKQATENGEEVLDDLTLLRNKTRQATITRELSEIVGGASILV
ncbi:MAG TPA: ATP synthase F1 subunit gamma [Candidatus Omnitrophota bacterium]|nr:ATP synthase F1 subunit gamma [Candidatus Omnitrophota bacterium]